MSEKNGFEYSYSAPTEEERKEVERIKRDYLPKEKSDFKLDRLRNLDKKVKSGASAIGIAFGVVGTLVLGTGMAMVLEWNMIFGGITVGGIGMILIALAYPLNNLIYSHNKKKYASEILKIADEILKDK